MENFNKIYSDYHKLVFIFTKTKVSNEVAEELTQDIFMKIHKNLHRYDPSKAKLVTWIMSIAKNSVIDHYRKIKLKTISINSMIDETGRELFQPSTNDSPLSEMLNSEYKKLLNDVIIKLPKIYKRMANLYYNIDMSYDEISERVKCPLGTVKGTLFRARKEMRKSLPALA